jgi:hypothetical protein
VRAPEKHHRIVALAQRGHDLAELDEDRLVRAPGRDTCALDARGDRVERELRLGGTPEVVGREVFERALERLQQFGERPRVRRRRLSSRDGDTPEAGAP